MVKWVRDSIESKPYDSHKDKIYHAYIGTSSYTVSYHEMDKPSFSGMFQAYNDISDMVSLKLNRKNKTATIEKEHSSYFTGGYMGILEREYKYKPIKVDYKYALRCWNILDKLFKEESTSVSSRSFEERYEMLTHFNFGERIVIKDTSKEFFEAKKLEMEASTKRLEASDEEAHKDVSPSDNKPKKGKLDWIFGNHV